MNEYKKLCLEILDEMKKRRIKDQSSLNTLKIELLRKHKRIKKIPTNIEIANFASEKDRDKYRQLLTIKPIRSLSGVSVIAVMTKPFKCPHVKKGFGPCIMCPGGINSYFGSIPQSYTGKEPATRRAIRNKYDPYLQVMNRLEQYIAMNKIPDKIELIIMGGTFPSYPRKYQEDFIKYCFKAMNDFGKLFFNSRDLNIRGFLNFFELPGEIDDKKRTNLIHNKLLLIKDLDLNNKRILKTIKNKFLNQKIIKSNIKKNYTINYKEKNIVLYNEQVINETSKIRCVALCIETRPDYCSKKEINEMLRLGCTRVELGLQTIYDDVLKKIKRGHKIEDSIKATQFLKDSFLKVGYHLMPGLPSVSYKQDLKALKELIDNPLFRPDALKIYPCMVLKGTKLYTLYKANKYKPLTTEEATNLIIEFK
jgi:elongator complex protein 3